MIVPPLQDQSMAGVSPSVPCVGDCMAGHGRTLHVTHSPVCPTIQTQSVTDLTPPGSTIENGEVGWPRSITTSQGQARTVPTLPDGHTQCKHRATIDVSNMPATTGIHLTVI